jgi:hypothetical protein
MMVIDDKHRFGPPLECARRAPDPPSSNQRSRIPAQPIPMAIDPQPIESTESILRKRQAARERAIVLIARAEKVEAMRVTSRAIRDKRVEEEEAAAALLETEESNQGELALLSSSLSTEVSHESSLAAAQAIVSKTPATKFSKKGECDARASFLPVEAMRRQRRPKRRKEEKEKEDDADTADNESTALVAVEHPATALVVYKQEPEEDLEAVPPPSKRLKSPRKEAVDSACAPTTAEDDGL